MELEIQDMAVWEEETKGWKPGVLLIYKAMELLHNSGPHAEEL